jgi:NAD(P)-dependent dehydrogenase (short-subunit alcohol dehydrogenase family)
MSQTNKNKTVVITGASSGIGRSCVARMNRAGWSVFATVRKMEDGNRLKAAGVAHVFPVIMDVRDESSIINAAEEVASQVGAAGLDGLVNVAGIGMMRPVEYSTTSELHEIFEINVFGQIAVTQAFCSLLKAKAGRIVNITSVGVNIAIPFGGLLNSSKSAFSMLSDSLRLELHPFGVRVCAVEPGAISTPAVEKTLGDVERVIASLPAEGRAQYAGMLRNFAKRAYAREKNGSAPEAVARAVHHALTSNRPRIRYRVGKHAKLLATLPRILPEQVLDALRLRMFGLPTRLGANARENAKPAGQLASVERHVEAV